MAGKLGEVFVEILGDASPFADDFADALGAAGDLAADELTGSLGEATEEAGGELVTGMEDAGAEMVGALGEAGEEAGGELADGLGSALDDVDLDGSGMFDGISAAASDAAGDAADALEGGLAGLDLDVGAGGAFDSIAEEAESAASDAADAFDGLGDSIASEIEAGVDDASGSFDGLMDKMGSVQGSMATLAGGAGLEGFARGAGDSTAAIARMSDRLGESDSDIRSMIDGITDWTFSSNDAAAGMELLSQRGVDNLDTIEKLLPVWDDYADATGQDFEKAIELGTRAMGAFGIGAEDAGDHVDTLTFLTNELDIPLDRIGRQFRGSEEDLAALGIGMDETTGLLAALRDQGLDGRDALNVLGKEIGNADGSMEELLDSLGLTAEEFDTYTAKVTDAEGITSRQADIANSTATPMERLGGVMENLAFRFGNFGQVAGMLAAPLGALGPAMMTINMGGGVLAKTMPALGKGLRAVTGAFRALGVAILTNPIFLIAAVIIGIVAVIWIFRDEIMAALGAAWDWIKDVFGNLVDWFRDVWERVVEVVPETFGRMLDWLRELPGRILDAIQGLATTVLDFIMEYHPLAILWRAITGSGEGSGEGVLGWLRELPMRIVETLQGLATTVFDFIMEWHPLAIAWRLTMEFAPQVIEAIVAFVTSVAETIAGWVETIVGFVTDLWQRWVELVHTIRDAVVDAIVGLAVSVVSTVTQWVLDIVGFVTGLRDQWLELVGAIRDRVVDFIVGMAARVVSTVSGWVVELLGFVRNLRDDFLGTISELIDGAVQWFRDLPGMILDAVKDFGSLLIQVGKDLIGGLVSGIRDMAMAPVNAVRDVGSAVVGGAKRIFGIGSPSRVFAEEIGGPLMEGAAVGIERMAPDAIDAIERFANEATSAGEMGALFNEEDLRAVGPETRNGVRPDEIGRPGTGAVGGVTWNVEQTVTAGDPQEAADESVRRIRELATMGAPFDPPENGTDDG